MLLFKSVRFFLIKLIIWSLICKSFFSNAQLNHTDYDIDIDNRTSHTYQTDAYTNDTFSTTQFNSNFTESETYSTVESTTISRCFINLTNVTSSEYEIRLNLITDLGSSFVCFANGTELVIENNFNETFFNQSIVCSNLEPIQNYTLNFITDCDVYTEYQTIQTNFEILKCKNESILNNSLEISVTCEKLKCKNCMVVFELYDKEKSTFLFKNISTTEEILYVHTFSELDCGLFDLKAYITKEYYNKSDEIIIHDFIEVFPTNVNLSIRVNHTTNIFEFSLTNNWKNCQSTTIIKKIYMPIECFNDTLRTAYQNSSIISYSDYLNETIIDVPVKYTTNYTFEIIILKTNTNLNYSRTIVNSTIELETDGPNIEILSVNFSSTRIDFEFSKPENCSDFSISCFGVVKIPVIFLSETRGYCQNLESNEEYEVIASTRNHSQYIVNSKKNFTTIVPVRFESFNESKVPLIFNYLFNCNRVKFDSYEIYYSVLNENNYKLKHVKENKTCTSLLESIGFVHPDEMFFGTKYSILFKTYGCRNTCWAETYLNISTRLDDFKIGANDFSVLTTNDSLSMKFNSTSLPRESRGKIFIKCNYKSDTKFRECNLSALYVTCDCIELENSNSDYSIMLINEKEDYTTVEKAIDKKFYTKPKPVIFHTIDFNGLVGNIDFKNPEKGISEFEICYLIANRPRCSEFNQNDTIFDGTNKEQFNFGQIYPFFIKSIGCGNELCKVDSNIVNGLVGLDRVKLDSNYVINKYQNNISLSFNYSLLPKPNYDYISIRCMPTEAISIRDDTFNCSNRTQDIICNCISLVESSIYYVSILTNKASFTPASVNIIEPVRTKPPIVDCQKLNKTATIFDIICQINLSKKKLIDGIKLILKEKNSGNSEITTVCLTNSNNCEVGDLLIQNLFVFKYKFRNLNPATEYRLECLSFYDQSSNDFSSKILDNLKTDLDVPEFLDISRESGRLKLKFNRPKAVGYKIIFQLLQKSHLEFEEFDDIEYTYTPSLSKKINDTSDYITFEKKISWKFGVEYKIKGEIMKINFEKVRFEFEKNQQIFKVPFPEFAIALISIFGFLMLVLPPSIYVYIKKRKEYNSKNKHLLKPSELKKVLENWDRHQNAGLENEWQSLTKEATEIEQREKLQIFGRELTQKNRYQDILPYDHSRIRLLTIDHSDSEQSINNQETRSGNSYYFDDDYINANFIPGLEHEYEYIACQAPLQNTIGDFWRMVWERYISVIIMLANVYEEDKKGKKKKCDVYWPNDANEKRAYGAVSVRLKKKIETNDYVIRIIIVEADGKKHEVRHYHYLSWPDRNFPNKKSLSKFMNLIRTQSNDNDKKGPVVVHCSAGIGRTGTYLAIEPLAELVRKKKKIDIYQRVLEMRRYRHKMVQNSIQYRFIYEMLNYIYENESEDDSNIKNYFTSKSEKYKYVTNGSKKSDNVEMVDL